MISAVSLSCIPFMMLRHGSFLKFLLIYFWLCFFFVAVHGLSLVVVSRGSSSCGVRASHGGSFSRCGAWAPCGT